jgi:MtN3 and saliva related transmembrane protein
MIELRGLTTVIGFIAGGLTTFSFVPQVLKTYRHKSAKELSYGMLLAFALGVALWLVYGLMLGSLPIILTNAVTLALVLIIIVLKVRYHN